MEIKIRPAVSSDSAACGRVLADAFRATAQRHGFPEEFDAPAATEFAAARLDHPEIFGLVAEAEGGIAGLIFLDERAVVRGAGPLAVAPPFQGRGIGRLLADEVIRRSLTAPGMRAVLDGLDPRALSLHTSLGFEVKEPLVLLRGRPKERPAGGAEVRPMACQDIEACAELSERAHGFARTNELRDAVQNGSPVVALRGGRVTAYATAFGPWHAGHGVADSEEDLKALVEGAAAASGDLSFLLPTRQASLFRWCLGQGFGIVRPMVLVSLGEYQEPACCWFPSGMF